MKNFKNKTFKIQQNFILFLTVILLSFLTSCSKSDDTDTTTKNVNYELPIFKDNPNAEGYTLITKQVPYLNLDMPTDPQKLVYDINKKDVPLNTIKDTVVVYIEGGPGHKIGDDLSTIRDFISSKLPNYSTIGLKQDHAINPTVFGSGSTFTSANAYEVNNKTIDILKTVITWLKSNHKVVYVFGHSNGSFVVQNYMSTNQISPDGYIISGTRLKSVQAFFENYSNNNDISFTNGTTPVIKKVPLNELPYFNVLSKLQLNHMKNYNSLLLNNSMLSKTVYLLAGKDEAVGAINEDEKDFINSNKIGNLFLPEGTHGDAPTNIANALLFLRKPTK